MKKLGIFLFILTVFIVGFAGTVVVNDKFALSVPAYTPPGIQETDQTASVQFNCGSSSGTTDVSVNIRFKLIGNMVFATIPNFFCNVAAGGAYISTQNSAAPGGVPAEFRPPQQQDFSSAWVRSSTSPAIQTGAVAVTSSGIIQISYNGAFFPGDTTGGFGFSGNEQTLMWPVSGS